VLVTAASSYTGANVVLALLQNGFQVRAGVRTQSRADALSSQLEGATDLSGLSFGLVPDGSLPGAYDEVVKDVSAVIHVAAPLPFPCDDIGKNILQKGVDMNRSLLESCAKTSSVKRVVLTGSADSLFDWSKKLFHDHTYNGTEWTPSTWEEAEKSQTFLDILPAAKKYAEQAAWKFVSDNEGKIGFDLISILPVVTLGPYAGKVSSVKEIGGSAFFVVYKAQTSQEDGEVGPVIIPHAVDVRDVALAHVRALTHGTAGRRYVLSAVCFDNDQVLHLLAKKGYLKRKVEVPDVDPTTKGYFQIDNTATVQDLKIQFRPFEQTVIDTAEQFKDLSTA